MNDWQTEISLDYILCVVFFLVKIFPENFDPMHGSNHFTIPLHAGKFVPTTLAGNRDRSENLLNIGKYFLPGLSESTYKTTHKTEKWRSAYARSRGNFKFEKWISKTNRNKKVRDRLIKINFAYHHWIPHKISRLRVGSEFWIFVPF